MNKETIKIGTRGSKLAVFQAEQVKNLIEKLLPGVKTELVIVKTKGDEVLNVALSKIGDKGLFTKELEDGLLQGTIDIAVHSLKDLPTELPQNFKVSAVLERADSRDVLVCRGGKKLSQLTPGDRIATSSLRRKAGLLCINNRFQIVDIRGNVNTRLQKMEDGYCDAIVMAAAGLKRLGLDNYITEYIQTDTLIPAVCQGIIAIESLSDNQWINEICQKLNHPKTWQMALAERAFLKTMQGGCLVPAGCHSVIDKGVISLEAFIASTDGKQNIREKISGNVEDGFQLGETLAKRILDLGGEAILQSIRNE